MAKPRLDDPLTADQLRVLLDYDPDTGIFTWKASRTTGRGSVSFRIGTSAGHQCKRHGYMLIGINKRLYRAHRLAWFHTYGAWPAGDLDHVNGNRADNRLTNLREASRSENCWNSRKSKNNTSGFKGVFWSVARGKWYAQILVDYRTHNLGYFPTAEAAATAYAEAAARLHGKFANLG